MWVPLCNNLNISSFFGYEWDYDIERHNWNDQQKANLEQLRQRLCDVAIWRDVGEMVEYLTTKDWALEYYGCEEELSGFVEAAKEKVLVRGLAGI